MRQERDPATPEDAASAIENRSDVFGELVENNPLLMAALALIKAEESIRKYNSAVKQLRRFGFNQFPTCRFFGGESFAERGGVCHFDANDIVDMLDEDPAPMDQHFLEIMVEQAKAKERSMRPPKTKPAPNYANRVRRRLGRTPDEWRCAYCTKVGTEVLGPDGRVWHVDHMYPRVHGGDDDKDNKILACATCNGSKGSKTAVEHVSKLSSGGADVQ